VPHLQRVFQADACHMSFGKYTLYSCYGTTANGNTSLVAFGIHFENEDKDGWLKFCKFAKNLHPILDDETVTIITDQAKGLIEALREVLPKAAHFHCSFHRRQNIAKIVRGGNVKYSCLWLFNKLVNASTKAEIEHIQSKTAAYMDDKAMKYLTAPNDEQQYPGARCDTPRRNVFMYQCSASSAAESMNRANQSARARMAVDPVCSTTLLMVMSAEKYQRKKEEA
jgi:hypothetical protein